MTTTQSTELVLLPQPIEQVQTTSHEWDIAVVRANSLHNQIAGLSKQIQILEQQRWVTAAVLGGLLIRMKEASQHGEWKALFTKSDTCVTFEYRTAARYMKLHREVLKRAKKLGTVDIALLSSGRRDALTLEEISKLSDADSLRQAYLDFGIITPTKKHGFTESGNPEGRPTTTQSIDDALAAIGSDEEIMTARKLQARQDYASILSGLETYIIDGLHRELSPSERSFFADALIDKAREINTPNDI